MVHAWLAAPISDVTRQHPNRRSPHQLLSIDDLRQLGVRISSIRGDSAVREKELSRIFAELGCIFRDEVRIELEDSEHSRFFHAHCHEKVEIRYIAAGECYFDVETSVKGEFVRMLCETGDLVVFPPGVVHRFTTTEKINLHMIRLFTSLPEYMLNGREQPDVVPGSGKWFWQFLSALPLLPEKGALGDAHEIRHRSQTVI